MCDGIISWFYSTWSWWPTMGLETWGEGLVVEAEVWLVTKELVTYYR